MPRGCFIPGCRTHKDYYERGIAMFSYPRDPDLIKAWNVACSREPDFQPPGYACICEKHFDPNEIQTKLSGRCKLLRNAVPTRFLDGWKPEHIQTAQNEQCVLEEDHLNKALFPEKDTCPPNVEKVFIKEVNHHDVGTDIGPFVADMFCRMCGIKQEKGIRYRLEDLGDDIKANSLINLCLVDYVYFGKASEICPQCYDKLIHVLDFIQKCHEGQQKLLEQFYEYSRIAMPSVSDDDPEIDLGPNIIKTEDTEDKIFREENDFEGRENAHLDQYIDQLIIKLKDEGKKIRKLIKTWECLDCRQMFHHRTHLTKHRLTCSLVGSKLSKRRGPFPCELCSKVLSTLPGYRYHLMKMHDNEKTGDDGDLNQEDPKELKMLKSNKVLACPICTQTFRTAGELRYHLPSHKSANHDKYRILARTSDIGHTSRSAGQYMCSFCGKMKKSNAALETHMKFHLKQKDWTCEQCEKQYYTKADLKQHVMIAHEKIKYTCEDCGATLCSKATYTRHKRLHNESLMKKCMYCPKKFTTINARNKHVGNRHQGLQRPQLHDIVMPEARSGQDGDRLEEILEEVVIGESHKEESEENENLYLDCSGDFIVS